MANILGSLIDDSLWTSSFHQHIRNIQANSLEPAPLAECLLRFPELPEFSKSESVEQKRDQLRKHAEETQFAVRACLRRLPVRFDVFTLVNAINLTVALPSLVGVLQKIYACGGTPLESIDHLGTLHLEALEDLEDPIINRIAQETEVQRAATRIPPQAAVPGLAASAALRYLTGDGVAVAIIDTGIDLGHADFRGRPAPTAAEAAASANGSEVILGEVRVGEEFVQDFTVDNSLAHVEVQVVFGLQRPHPHRNGLLMVQEKLDPRVNVTVTCDPPGVCAFADQSPAATAINTSPGNMAAAVLNGMGRRIVKRLVANGPFNGTGRCRVRVTCPSQVAGTDFPWNRALYKLAVEAVDNQGIGKRLPFTGVEDDWGHGSIIAGVVAGSGASSQGEFAGIAPGARVVPIKAVVNAGVATPNAGILKALQWLHTRDDVRLVNISLGLDGTDCRQNDPNCAVCAAVNRAVHHFNKIIVVSAGNRGNQGVTCPGDAAEAICVGSATAEVPWRVAPRSSYNQYLGMPSKPDLVAIGEGLVAPLARFAVSPMKLNRNVLEVDLHGPLAVGAPYRVASGTSIAAAVVTGIIARLLQHHPEWTAAEVRDLLRRAALTLTDPATGARLTGQGAGLLTAEGLTAALCPLKLDQVTVNPAAVRPGATVRLQARVRNDSAHAMDRVRVTWAFQGAGHAVLGSATTDATNLGANAPQVLTANLAVPAHCPPGAYALLCSAQEVRGWHDGAGGAGVALEITDGVEWAHRLERPGLTVT